MSKQVSTQFTNGSDQSAEPTSPWTELFQHAADQADIREQAMQARMQHSKQHSTPTGAQQSAAESAAEAPAECPTTDALSAIFNNVR